MKNVFLILTIVCSLSLGCEKEVSHTPQIIAFPAATTGGYNTFGCYVDGEEFIARTEDDSEKSPIKVKYNSSESYFSILCYDYIRSEEIYVRINYPIIASDSQLLTEETCVTQLTGSSLLKGRRYFIDNQKHPSITILKDDQTILSGTFNFEAICEDGGDLMSITNGRFDIHK